MKNTYIVLRHAHSRFSSDDFNRTLSEKGFSSLEQLEFLNACKIDYFISSPYKRAFETVNSSPVQFDKIVLDNRLRERTLSSRFIEDTEFEKTIQYLWQNPDKSLIGGESNREALKRILDGNLLGILINHFDSSFDYKKWEQMTFPDCFLVDKDESVKRMMPDTFR